MTEMQSRHSSVIFPHSRLARTSLGKRFEPMPTQVTPALNQADRLSSLGETPPVTMIFDHGIGPLIFFTKDGPPTSPPGKSFTISAPSSWAYPISVVVAQPGE